jgi:outer membrane cobalamin receptor
LSFGQIKQLVVSDTIVYAYELEEIVFYGSRSTNPSMLTELKSQDIENRNVVTTADLLKSDPGLTITAGTKAETESKIRGFPARDVLVLVDGHPINPGYYGKVDLSMLPVDNIAKINIAKGPSSVAYGMNNMGGVIDIITKNGFENPKTIFDISVGDYQFRKMSLNHSRQIENINYWISGYENYSKGYKLSNNFTPTSLEDGGLRNNSLYHKAGGNLKLGYQTDDKDLYSFSFGYHWAKKDIPSTIYSWDSPTYRKFPDWQRYSAALSGQWKLSHLFELKTILYVDEYNDRLIDYLNKEMRSDQILWDSYLESWTAGGSVEGKFILFDSHQIHSGLNFRRDLMNKQPDIGEAWETNFTYSGNMFIQDYFKLWEGTEITTGLSFTMFKGEDSQLKEKISPMISINQLLPANLRAYISYANSIRVPTLHHLYSQTSGNPDLLPEEADKFETGIEWFHLFDNEYTNLSIQLAYFYNNLKNLIYRASSSYRYKNISDANMQGIEVRTIFDYNQSLSAEIGFCNISSLGSTREIMEEVPENKFHFTFSYKTNFNMSLNYEFSYYNNRITYIQTKNLESYTIHNVNLIQQVFDFLKLRLELSNITDENYEEELGYPGTGRFFIMGLNLVF